MEREGDRELWKPELGNAKASAEENDRVRALLEEHLAAEAKKVEAGFGVDGSWGHARGEFARAWVTFALEQGLKAPGEDRRAPLKEGESSFERMVDAGRTRLRQFLEGHREQEWVLVGIEATICDRRGMALPAKAYQVQQKLEVGS